MCKQGFISLPKGTAPKRFSIQTGLICNLFGVSHPVCKWVDEILPELPLSDLGKEIARRIRIKNANKISTKVFTEFFKQTNFLKKILDDIKTSNQLIEDIWDTIQGGEVDTLEFCLAGKPELPPEINWADIFLAFSRVYPSSLLDKLSQIIAFEKYFEYCECQRVPTGFDAPSVPAGEIVSPPPPIFEGEDPCTVRFQHVWNTAWHFGTLFNYIHNELNTVEKCREKVVLDAFSAFYPLEILQSWELIECPSPSSPKILEFRDIQSDKETVFFEPRPDGMWGGGCCEVIFQRYIRVFRENNLDVRYTYQATSGLESVLLSELTNIPICDGFPYLGLTEYWKYPVRLSNLCSRFSEDYPPEYDFRRVRDIDPSNPCNGLYKPRYKDLCPECPQIQPQSTVVRIIRNCEEFLEPRSLYLP